MCAYVLMGARVARRCCACLEHHIISAQTSVISLSLSQRTLHWAPGARNRILKPAGRVAVVEEWVGPCWNTWSVGDGLL